MGAGFSGSEQRSRLIWLGIAIAVCLLLVYSFIYIQNLDFPLEEPANLILLVLIGICVLAILALGYFIWQSLGSAKELKKTTDELNYTRNTLVNQEKLASLGIVAAGIIHEIKNPLNYIQNFTELTIKSIKELQDIYAKIETALPAEQQQGFQENCKTIESNLEIILKQSRRANNTIQRILMHAKPSGDTPVITDIHELIEEYLTLSYQGMRAKDQEFNVKISKLFEAPVYNVKVYAEDIGRVFLNIFNNAYYALNEKRKKMGNSFSPTLVVSTKQHNNHLEIRIKDNGDGIPASIREGIFTPFFTTKPPGEGTGLGLSLSRNIIEDEHKGKLSFSSEEGAYTEFIIILPAE